MGWNAYPPDPISQLDDDQVIEQIRENPAMFDVLYARYFQRVYRYCLKRTGNVQQAEDLCSEVFIRVFHKLDTYKGGNFAAWLFRIAHNIVVDHYRSQQEVVGLDTVQLKGESHMSNNIANQMLVEEMLATLSEEERELLSLRLDMGLSAPEIAERTGKTANAVRVQVYRLLKRLRNQYIGVLGGEA